MKKVGEQNKDILKVVDVTTPPGSTVMISSNDKKADYLINKLVASTGITLTENHNGGIEDLSIACHVPVTLATNHGLGLSGQVLNMGTPSTCTAATTNAVTTTTHTHEITGFLTTVTPHDLLSVTHGDTTASSVTRGDIIIGSGATPKWDNLAVGITGTYLAGGTEPSWATLNQAAVAGLTTADGPTFDHLHITDELYFDEADWIGGNVTYVPIGGDIQSYVAAATAGDTLILASGQYVITSSITIDKQLNIVGQGNAGFLTAPVTAGHGTLISSTTGGIVAIQIDSNNVRIANLSLNLTGAASTGVNTANNLTGIVLTNIDVIVTCTGLAQGFTIYGSNVVMRDLTFYITSTNNGSSGFWLWNDSSTTQSVIVDCYNVTGTVVGAGSYAYAFVCENINDANTLTMNLESTFATALSGTPLDVAVASISTTTNNSIVNCSLCTLDGADYDAYQTGTNKLNLGGSVLMNNLVSGTVTYRAALAAGLGVFSGMVTANQFTSTVAIGTAPLVITSTTAISNLNADLLDGNHAAAFLTSVTPHNILSTTHGDTTVSAPNDQDVLTWDAGTSKWIAQAGGGGGYTDEQAQDAVGGIFGPSLIYVDGTPSMDTVQDIRTSASPAFSNITASPTLSVEQITNFAGWTPTGSWSYGSGKWSHTTGDATALTATGETAIVVGTKYEIIVTHTTTTAGSGFSVQFGGQAQSPPGISSGTNTYNMTARSTAALSFTPTGGTWVGSIDAVSIKIVTEGIVNCEGLTLNSGQILLLRGNQTYPSWSFNEFPTTGFYYGSSNSPITMSLFGLNRYAFGPTYFIAGGTGGISFGYSDDMFLSREAAATLQLGNDAASPINQVFKSCDGSGTNKAGSTLYLKAGQGTGTGIGGSLIFSTAPAGGAGSGLNAYVDRMSIDSTGAVTIGTLAGVLFGTAGVVSALTSTMSVTNSAGNLQLSGDAATPGNSKYYGTDSSGTKGFNDLPGGLVGSYVPRVAYRKFFGALPHYNTAHATNCGLTTSGTLSLTYSGGASLGNLLTGSVAGNYSSVYTSLLVTEDANPDVTFVITTDAAIANTRIWIGAFSSATFAANDDPYTLQIAGVRYTSGTANWYLYTADNGGASATGDTGTVVATSTKYTIRIWTSDTGTTWNCTINGGATTSLTSHVPAGLYFWMIRIDTKENAGKTLFWEYLEGFHG